MGRINLIFCDECGREENENEIVDWIEISNLGPPITMTGVPEHKGVFCGARCLAARMNRTVAIQEEAYGREPAI